MTTQTTGVKKEKIAEFLKLHAASSNFSGGARQLYTLEGAPKLITWYRQQPQEIETALENIAFHGCTAYYTTKNSFFADKRSTNTLFSLDNIVIDLDCHEKSLSDREYSYECSRLIYLLENDNGGRIPQFNACRSGRGLHLWTALQSSSAKLLPMYQLYSSIIADNVQRVCSELETPFSIDTAASLNAAGLIRLPYTYNASAARIALFEKRTEHRYTLDELQELCALNLDRFGRVFEKQKGHRTAETAADRAAYKPLNRKRMRFIEALIKDTPKQTGRRSILLFLYLNAAYSLAESEDYAMQKAAALNAQLSEPQPQKELERQLKAVVSYGGLDFTKERFFEFMQATALERLAYQNVSSEREAQRAEARQNKQERNAQIIELHNKGFSSREIAAKVGCDFSTVSRFLKSV